jgi:hypothetical protein
MFMCCFPVVAACVLEQIEKSIKEGALELLKQDSKRFAEVCHVTDSVTTGLWQRGFTQV